MTCSNNETKVCCNGPHKIGRFQEIGNAIGALVDEKNAAYGDSFARAGKIMQILYPEGVGAHQLDDALAIIRVLDKLFRIATKKDAFGEDPWRDIAGYAILAVARNLEPADDPEWQAAKHKVGADLLNEIEEGLKAIGQPRKPHGP